MIIALVQCKASVQTQQATITIMEAKALLRKHGMEAQTASIAPQIDSAEQRYSIVNRYYYLFLGVLLIFFLIFDCSAKCVWSMD